MDSRNIIKALKTGWLAWSQPSRQPYAVQTSDEEGARNRSTSEERYANRNAEEHWKAGTDQVAL